MIYKSGVFFKGLHRQPQKIHPEFFDEEVTPLEVEIQEHTASFIREKIPQTFEMGNTEEAQALKNELLCPQDPQNCLDLDNLIFTSYRQRARAKDQLRIASEDERATLQQEVFYWTRVHNLLNVIRDSSVIIYSPNSFDQEMDY